MTDFNPDDFLSQTTSESGSTEYLQPLEGVYNAVAPNPVSQTHFISALATALNRPYFLPPIPKFVLQLILSEMSSLVLDSHWVSAQKVLDKGYHFVFPQLEEALQDVLKNKR